MHHKDVKPFKKRISDKHQCLKRKHLFVMKNDGKIGKELKNRKQKQDECTVNIFVFFAKPFAVSGFLFGFHAVSPFL